MRVDGRVAMARDEHRELGKRLDIHTDFDTTLEIPVCRAIVVSELYGESSGTIEVKIGGKGVDETNPLANAETSAIGRALGFMGYGLLGGGIASAEEVETAIASKPVAPKSTKVAEADPYDLPTKAVVEPVVVEEPDDIPEVEVPAPVATGAKASEKQINFIRSLLSEHGTIKGDSLPLIEKVYPEGMSKADASADIEDLRDAERLPDKYLAGYINILRERAKLRHADIYDYMQKYFNITKLKDVSREQQDSLIGWLTIGQEREEVEEEWEDMIEHIAGVCMLKDLEIVKGWVGRAFLANTSRDKIMEMVSRMNPDDIKADIATYQKTLKKTA
jgi:hypothetical protein